MNMVWVIAIIVIFFLIGVANDIYSRTPAGKVATKAAEARKAADSAEAAALKHRFSPEGQRETELMLERMRAMLPEEFKKQKEAEKHVQMLRDGGWPHSR